MIGLPGIVVNPFSCGVRVVCNALEGDRIYGLVDETHTHVIDLVAGAVYQAPVGGQMVWCFGDYLDPSVHIPPTPKGIHYDDAHQAKVRAHNEAARKARKKIPVSVSPFAVGCLSTITAGRVSAEDLVKGLKARGVELSCRVRNNYAGGWDFYVKDGDGKETYWTVEDFVTKCFPQRVTQTIVE